MANFINRKMSPFSFIFFFFFFQLPRRLLFIRFAEIPQSPKKPRYRLHSSRRIVLLGCLEYGWCNARSKRSIVTPRNNGRPSVESTSNLDDDESLYIISFLSILIDRCSRRRYLL
jgi:hypothetical protein